MINRISIEFLLI